MDVIIEMFLMYAVILPAHCLRFYSSNFTLFIMLLALFSIQDHIFLSTGIIFRDIN